MELIKVYVSTLEIKKIILKDRKKVFLVTKNSIKKLNVIHTFFIKLFYHIEKFFFNLKYGKQENCEYDDDIPF